MKEATFTGSKLTISSNQEIIFHHPNTNSMAIKISIMVPTGAETILSNHLTTAILTRGPTSTVLAMSRLKAKLYLSLRKQMDQNLQIINQNNCRK
jgi:hypothetical protein